MYRLTFAVLPGRHLGWVLRGDRPVEAVQDELA